MLTTWGNAIAETVQFFNPVRILNDNINKEVEKRLESLRRYDVEQTNKGVLYSISYNIHNFNSWLQSYWDFNPIHRNPKFQGINEFSNMDSDTKILSNFNQRKDTVCNQDFMSSPAIENDEYELTKAGFVDQVTRNIRKLPNKKKGFLSDMDFGYSFSEKRLGFRDVTFTINLKISKKKRQTLTKTIKDALVITDIDNLIPTAFSFDGRRNIWFAADSGSKARKITPQEEVNLIRSTFDDRFGSPYGWPLKAAIFPHWIMKKAIMQWRLIYLEKFGIPTVLGTHPATLDKDNDLVKDFYAALGTLMQSSRILKPEGFTAEFLQDNNKAGTMDVFQNALNYIDHSISELVLGHKQATEATSIGSLASSTVKEQALRQAIYETDTMRLDTIMAEQVYEFLIDLNFPYNGLYPDHISYMKDKEAIEERRDTFEMLLANNMDCSETQIRRELHVDSPIDEFDIVEGQDPGRVLRYQGVGKNNTEKPTNGEDKETNLAVRLSRNERRRIRREIIKDLKKDKTFLMSLIN